MNAEEIVKLIEDGGGTLVAEGERLRYRIPEELDWLVPYARKSKPSLLAFLNRREGVTLVNRFESWVIDSCVLDQHCFSPMGCLYINFSLWLVERHAEPCERATFEQLVAGLGLSIKNGLAFGIVSHDDFESDLGSSSKTRKGPILDACASTAQ